MGKAFIVSSYLGSSQPEKLAEYADPARKVIEGTGGWLFVRKLFVHIYEDGLSERTIIIEFVSVEQSMAAQESPSYQAVRKLLGPVSRDVRIVEQPDQPNISGDDKQIIDGRMKTCKTHYQMF